MRLTQGSPRMSGRTAVFTFGLSHGGHRPRMASVCGGSRSPLWTRARRVGYGRKCTAVRHQEQLRDLAQRRCSNPPPRRERVLMPGPMEDHPVISLREVRKVYGDVVALDGVDLEIEKGTIHGIVGPSGAGKSTLVRCLTGLDRPTSGVIEVAGQNLSEVSESDLRQARRRIGMVFQHVNLFDARTAAENIAYPLRIAGVPAARRAARVQELLDLVGLGNRGGSYPSQLSGGQKQRIGIARALATDPDVLLCDEPTSALDSATTRQILDLIRDIRDRIGVTVVIITHEMDVVRQACDAVSLLDHGRVVESGRIADVVVDPATRLSHALVPLPPVPDTELAVIDVFFTSRPGEPTGARVFDVVAQLGGDVTAGTLETLGDVQVGRIALSARQHDVERLARGLREAGLHVESRS